MDEVTTLTLETVIFDNKFEADFIVNELKTLIARYGDISISDYYDMITIPYVSYTFSDTNFGWTDVSETVVKPVSLINNGLHRTVYEIILPPAIRLDGKKDV